MGLCLCLAGMLDKAIKAAEKGGYLATIYVHGIDRQRTTELTNALRASGPIVRMKSYRSGRPG